MVLYEQEEMRPDNTEIDKVLKVYKLAKVKDQYVSPYADDATFFDSGKGYTYQILGEVGDFLRLTDFVKASWDSDYTGWSGSCSVEVEYKKEYLEYLQRGAYVELYVNRFPINCDVEYLRQLDTEEYEVAKAKADREREAYDRKWKNKTDAPKTNYLAYPVVFPYVQLSFSGFITDIKFNTTSLEITCTSYGAVLEEKATLSFSNNKRSNILSEVVQSSGLIPNIDTTDLLDQVIDWSSKQDSGDTETTNEASTGDDCTDTISMACLTGCSSSNHYGSNHDFDDCYKTGYAVVDTEYYKWARQYNSGEDMLRALRNIWKYKGYWNNRTCPQQLFNSSGFRCNCFDACRMVKVLCDSIGFPCVVVTGQAYEGGHGWNVIKTNGNWLSFDLCYNAHANASNSTNMSMIY